MRRLVLVENLPIQAVARKFGVHHSTVRNACQDGTQDERPATMSLLEPYKPYIVECLLALPEITGPRLVL